MSFQDHFSRQADSYAQFRPRYPRDLFDYLAEKSPERKHAWDAGCGNGQAAEVLAEFFEHVTATDPSEEQIRRAQQRPGILYKVAAEEAGLEPGSVDLITVAQAFHWFDHTLFFQEARRVLKPHGIVALWAYGLGGISTEVDDVLLRFYRERVGAYWPPERRYVDEGYRTIPFPLREMAHPEFRMEARWTAEHLLGYLRTWSAVEKCKAREGRDPVNEIAGAVSGLWPKDGRPFTWPLYVRIGTF